MQNPTAFIVPILLIAFVIFRRIKRAIGFQKYNAAGPIIRMVLFTIVVGIIFAFAMNKPPASLIADIAGLIVGIGLGFLGARHAVFEMRKDGLYYKTHIWIEIGILALFLARLAMRFYTLYSTLGNVAPEQAAAQLRYERDPVTGCIICVFGAYYLCYYIYIMSQANKRLKSQNPQ